MKYVIQQNNGQLMIWDENDDVVVWNDLNDCHLSFDKVWDKAILSLEEIPYGDSVVVIVSNESQDTVLGVFYYPNIEDNKTISEQWFQTKLKEWYEPFSALVSIESNPIIHKFN